MPSPIVPPSNDDSIPDPPRTATSPPCAPTDRKGSSGTFPTEAADLLRELNLSPALAGETLPGQPADWTTHGDESGTIPGYELLGELGRGGMGVVYKARQVALNRIVALKTMRGGRGSEREIARFLIEAEAVAAVEHPNVVRVHDYGDCDGHPYLVLEYLPGGSLSERLAREGKFSPREAAELVSQVARGVAAAHALGIIHRDLKPANILFGGDGRSDPGDADTPSGSHPQTSASPTAKVTDFGLAKRALSDLTATQAVMGTPAYMAPEQADGRTKFVGPAADVWALGVILYECLHGVRPFQADEVHALMSAIRSADVPARESGSAIPRELDLIVRKCLEKNPADRYANAADLADELGRFLRGEPVTVRPLGATSRAVRWVRRNPVVAALLGAVALVSVGLVVSLFNQYRQAEARADFERGAKEHAEQLAADNAKLAEAESARRAEAERLQRLADAEVRRANEVSDFMAGLFRSSDPLDFFGETVLPGNWEKQRSKTAEALLREAAVKFRAELTGQPLTRARLLAAVGTSLTNLGDHRTAGPLLREALDLRRANLPADHREVITSRLDLGRLLWHLGDYLAALEEFRAAGSALVRTGAPVREVLTARFQEALALTFVDPAEADAVFQQVIAGRQQLLGPTHPETMGARIGYASLLLNENRSADLLKFMPTLLDALQAPDSQYQKIAAAFIPFQIGVAYAQQAAVAPGKFLGDVARRQAEARLREALAKADGVLPPDHFLVGLIRYELAGVLEDTGKDDEAGRLYDRVLADVRKTVGLAHPKVLVLVRKVGDRDAKSGRVNEAHALWDEVEAANRDRFGPASHWLGVLLLSRVRFECRHGDLTRAVGFATEAAGLVSSGKLVPTRESAQALLRAAETLARPNLPGDGPARTRELFIRTREFVARVYGSATRETCIALRVEGRELFNMGDRAEGAARIGEAAKLGHLLRSEDEAERNDLSAALGMVANASGRFPEAARHYAAALTLSRRNEWPRDRVNDGWGLVTALAGQAKYAEAIPVMADVHKWTVANKASDTAVAWANYCLVLLKFVASDPVEFRDELRGMLRRHERAADAYPLARLAWSAGLSSATGEEAAAIIPRLTAALPAYPRYQWGRWGLGLLHLRRGDVEAAEAAINAGGPKWPSGADATEYHVLKGLCAAARGDSDAARKNLRRAEEVMAAEKPSGKNPFAFEDTSWADRLAAGLLAGELRAALQPRDLAPPPRELGGRRGQ